MSITKEEIDRIFEIKKRLELTFRSATNPEQRIRLKKDLNDIEEIIQNINDGKWVNPVKLKIFSGKVTARENEKKTEIAEPDTYNEVEIIKITERSRDQEMDELYSYFLYFENNFYPVFSLQNLKLRFDAGKRRDDFLVTYDMILRQINNYKNDIESAGIIRDEKQRVQYEERLTIEKYQIISKMDEFFKGLIKFVNDMNSGISAGEKIVLNPDEKYYDEHQLTDYGLLEGKKVMEIMIELEAFLKIFISKIKIPDFMKGKKV